MTTPLSAPGTPASPAIGAAAPSLDGLLERHRLPPMRHVAWLIMGLIAAFIAWAAVAQLDEVSVAQGEVAPQGKVKVIQHLEGGLILDIHVSEGDVVRPGDPLLLLDLATGGVNRDEMQVRLDGLRLTRARLQAEADGAPLKFPEAEAQRRPDLVRAEQETHAARVTELKTSVAVLQQQVNQRGAEVRELEAQSRATAANLKLAREKLGMSASLLKDGLTARMDHLQLQSEVEGLQGSLNTLSESVPRARAALAETEARLAEISQRFRREALEQIGETELNIARTEELLTKATDQQLRTEIRSPIDGIVKNMRHNTIGGVVRAGEPILDLVPSRDDLVVEARLNPVDRGYVRVGQEATIKISTYDYARYGGLKGQVVLVAPDSTVPENGQPFFRVQVKPEKFHLGDRPDEYVISPGMEATVDIHTGTRSVLDYLIKPVLKLKHEAFRER
ncbi:HlyD family type I secretion periplasmic adaptor subunit [Novispirillum sp. DQ9]|uniref:HlyD family type I secretion periplasmic adaptor subunit n=1 Tax=Novispirillum sp. DQ9 TaxID=3398612 RepID=UPI003C7CE4C0